MDALFVCLAVALIVAPLYWFAWDARKVLKHIDADMHERAKPPRTLADEGHLDD